MSKLLWETATNQKKKNMWTFIFKWLTKVTKEVLVCVPPHCCKNRTKLKLKTPI